MASKADLEAALDRLSPLDSNGRECLVCGGHNEPGEASVFHDETCVGRLLEQAEPSPVALDNAALVALLLNRQQMIHNSWHSEITWTKCNYPGCIEVKAALAKGAATQEAKG